MGADRAGKDGAGTPALVLLDPALGSAATLLQQALGPGFRVVVGSLPAGAVWPLRYVVVLAAADATLVAEVRGRCPAADLLVVTGGIAPGDDPRLVAAIRAAGADDLLTSTSVGELAAKAEALVRRWPAAGAPGAAPPPARQLGATPGPLTAARPSARGQALVRLASAKRTAAVAAVAAFTALVGAVAWAGARGADAAAPSGGGGVTQRATPQGPDGFFGGQGQGGYQFGTPQGPAGGSGSPAAGSSGAS
jgi:hypothetical protein